MAQLMTDNGPIIRLMGMEFTYGTTADSILASGSRMICMATASMFTQMVLGTMGNTKMIKKKAMVYTIGPMAVNTKAGGTKENNTVSEPTQTVRRTALNLGCGRLASA